MLFVDASYIIALVVEKDQWHTRAVELLDKVESRNKIISMPMVVETINLIGSCHGGKIGVTVYNYIKQNYEIINNDNLLDESIINFLKYEGTLSLADSTAITIMKQENITEIVSFNDDFDKVDGIIRIY